LSCLMRAFAFRRSARDFFIRPETALRGAANLVRARLVAPVSNF
jgi:hypothetical protein